MTQVRALLRLDRLFSWCLVAVVLTSSSIALAATPAPTVKIGATPAFLAPGATSKVTWSSTNAASCTASGNWSGTKATSGAMTTGALTGNVAYQLTCKGPGGSKSATAFINIKPTLTLSASPTTVAPGATSKLTWSATRATSCTASGNWTGTKSTAGSQATNALNANMSYTLTCSGSGGKVAQTVAVAVKQGSAAAPTVTLGASPTSVKSGTASQLTWSATNATSCAASGAWSGTKGTSGTQSTGTLTANSNYTLTCTGAGGSAAKTASVTVTTAPVGSPSVSLSANPHSVAPNTNTTLTWSGTNVTSCTASGGWSGTKATTGSQSVGPLTQDTTYTLTCSGGGGNAVAMTTISLRQAELSWTAPTKNTDGTAAVLSGYKIYYGTASKSYSQSVSVSGASTLQRTIALASAGTWYFAVASVDSKGVESAKSNEVSKVLP